MKKSTKIAIWTPIGIILAAVALFFLWISPSQKANAAEKELGVMIQDIWKQTSAFAKKMPAFSDQLKSAYVSTQEEEAMEAAALAKKQRKLKKAKKEEKPPEKPYVRAYELMVKAEENLLAKSKEYLPINSHKSFDKIYHTLKEYGQALDNLKQKMPGMQQIKARVIYESVFLYRLKLLDKSMAKYQNYRDGLGFADNYVDYKEYPKKYPPTIISEEKPKEK